MLKKLIQNLIPSPQAIKNHSSLGILGSLLEDPNLFHLNRYSVSMAFLVGVFLAFCPVPGQMVLAAIVAFWVRCNLPLAIALVWITNPLTVPPIFFTTYQLGTWLLDSPTVNLGNAAFTWEWVHAELGKLWKPLFMGSLCAGSFFSITSYSIIKLVWRWRVIYLWNHRKEKRAKRLLKKQNI
ncbi:ATP-binding protein [Candidatus Endobugula sertula]|uniref:ATP-binding protein n=1 Tax=Candidatus Endobugula sertula TaxID=62101 RepID=A0A1D2QST2_9GAMM|nr:ATP-binding protein [Candidatus Endobugula sertula]